MPWKGGLVEMTSAPLYGVSRQIPDRPDKMYFTVCTMGPCCENLQAILAYGIGFSLKCLIKCFSPFNEFGSIFIGTISLN
jgi:hypothetical protein